VEVFTSRSPYLARFAESSRFCKGTKRDPVECLSWLSDSAAPHPISLGFSGCSVYVEAGKHQETRPRGGNIGVSTAPSVFDSSSESESESEVESEDDLASEDEEEQLDRISEWPGLISLSSPDGIEPRDAMAGGDGCYRSTQCLRLKQRIRV
jgi:hypothetical protein